MNDLEEAVVMIIKHIRPDGYIYAFSLDESKRLKEIAKSIEEVNADADSD